MTFLLLYIHIKVNIKCKAHRKYEINQIEIQIYSVHMRTANDIIEHIFNAIILGYICKAIQRNFRVWNKSVCPRCDPIAWC